MNHLSNAHDVILGVDTHLEIHMGVLISSTGQWLGEFRDNWCSWSRVQQGTVH